MKEILYATNKLELQFPERICSLLGYGSLFNKRNHESSDADLFMLLDTHKYLDEKKIENTIKETISINNLNLDLSLQYMDELPSEIKFFQDGSKGCLALAYLSSAEILSGTNPFINMYENLDHVALKESIAVTVKYYLNKTRQDLIYRNDNFLSFEKYMARCLIDAMIFYDKTDMGPYKELSNNDVLTLASQHEELHSMVPKELSPIEIVTKIGNLVSKLEIETGIRHN